MMKGKPGIAGKGRKAVIISLDNKTVNRLWFCFVMKRPSAVGECHEQNFLH
jgi:hypothetical protein